MSKPSSKNVKKISQLLPNSA